MVVGFPQLPAYVAAGSPGSRTARGSPARLPMRGVRQWISSLRPQDLTYVIQSGLMNPTMASPSTCCRRTHTQHVTSPSAGESVGQNHLDRSEAGDVRAPACPARVCTSQSHRETTAAVELLDPPGARGRVRLSIIGRPVYGTSRRGRERGECGMQPLPEYRRRRRPAR